MKAMIAVAAFAAVLSCSFTPALAGPLVANGGFETGDFTGWQQVGDMTATGVYPSGIGLPVDDGLFSAAFGPTNYGGITQTINTVPGQNYIFSFDIANTDTIADDTLVASFDDGFQVEAGDLPPFGFQNISIPVVADGLTADVTFFYSNPEGYFLLDDVSVTPVPEPATWGLMLAGFALIGATMRRRHLQLA